MQDIARTGKGIRSIAFGPNDSWVILSEKTEVWYGGIPDELGKVLTHAIRTGLSVRCVNFCDNDWICLTDKGWWSSNANLPASRFIAKDIAGKVSPKWIAIRPASGT